MDSSEYRTWQKQVGDTHVLCDCCVCGYLRLLHCSFVLSFVSVTCQLVMCMCMQLGACCYFVLVLCAPVCTTVYCAGSAKSSDAPAVLRMVPDSYLDKYDSFNPLPPRYQRKKDCHSFSADSVLGRSTKAYDIKGIVTLLCR